jgi:predicted ATP-binding protein involved in virulence
MYLKNLLLENVGPIQRLEYELPFDPEGNPKPVIIVGTNGSGKSIVLAHIVNTLLSAQQVVFANAEVESGKVYKYRSPGYIHSGQQYYFAKLQFESDVESVEWQLPLTRGDFENQFNFAPNHREWERLPADSTSVFWSNMAEKRNELKDLVNKNVMIYFPPNRFEEPAWLNYENLIARAEYSDLRNIEGISNRKIIHYAPLRRNRDWLLDILFDRQALEIQTVVIQGAPQGGPQVPLNLFTGYAGAASKIYEAVLEIFRLVMRKDNRLRLGFGPRGRRQLELIIDERQWIPNVFQLSTGETSVLNLFLSLLRDYDLTDSAFESLAEVRGIVLIDEIDSHLHTELQNKVLPGLIKRFPKVQFIVTSHAPLFLMGMKRDFPDDSFRVLSLPEGIEIGVERFEEFEAAFETFRTSSVYENALALALENARKPVTFVEGNYDIQYLQKAAQLLGKNDILERVELSDGSGFGNLDKVWKSFDSRLAFVNPRRVVLIYDCDTGKVDADRGHVAKRIIPTLAGNPISNGIENLFPSSTIDSVRAANLQFIDVTPEIKKLVRGVEVNIPKKIEVNANEKRHLCEWLCEHGTAEDFEGFQAVFALIERALA